ncbi:GHKL domain-containing protein [Rhodocytophaga rosea]|uniref:histidine kinase n=1 Tax=Rhodocytophaga rosea TaxID=2704465 RepID=A0A6C0GP41_9BACT|nr:hybrid sensor histidine kinase/response regulator [Rhodocytophaga rosea]QHT69821.1 GHKL domain-containing protein [Rhodocytophaga rosea]
MKKASSYKILVLTEDTAAFEQYAALLAAEVAYSFDLHHFTSIALAPAEIEKYRPHCILMDADIQAEATIQFLQELKHSKSYRRYPVIWITAVNDAKAISRSIKMGVQDVLITSELSTELMVSTIVRLVKNSRFIEQLKEQRKLLLNKNKELSEYKKYLEMRVMSRTAELKDSYEQLVEEMTLRKHIEEQLTSRNKELDTFVYKASHDLKGPLASLIGVTNIARIDLTDPLSVKYLAMISDSAQKLNSTLANLLEVTKIKYMDAEIKEVNFQGLLEQVTAPLQKRMEEAQVTLKLSVQQPKSFFSDPFLISTLLNNLIDNSINYRSDDTSAFITIDISSKENNMEITIMDNGQGIEKEVQSKVFDMFFRHNMQAKGSGLGLYIVKNCVEKLNGTLTLLSEPGVGTEIKITLPNLKQE